MKKVLYFSMVGMFMLIFIVGCSEGATSNAIQQIHVSDIQERMIQSEATNDGAVYIDVREIHEYADAHIEGFINYPLSNLEETFVELPKDKEILIICRSGNRSMQAASLLKANGFDQVTNVQGAMVEWQGETKSN